LLERWQAGETGFPLVDAGMRELAATGWLHNRVRMVTASFLVKHLHLDWRVGEQWFAEKLLDYDPAQNEGNWQWVAGTGIDAQPWFRILNPERQRQRFDPDGAYCDRWRDRGYPEPMLDLKAEAAEAKERYRAAATL
jgi:deoxyribodipyrimidine photo-lyase